MREEIHRSLKILNGERLVSDASGFSAIGEFSDVNEEMLGGDPAPMRIDTAGCVDLFGNKICFGKIRHDLSAAKVQVDRKALTEFKNSKGDRQLKINIRGEPLSEYSVELIERATPPS
jgi:hypothetical protein